MSRLIDAITYRRRRLEHRLRRASRLHQMRTLPNLKINYGSGDCPQNGYVNIDLRWTPQVDLIADLHFCAQHLAGVCQEVYVSHVLEHYGSPGRAMRNTPDTVLGALTDIYRMLVPGGIIRIAVPDFAALAQVYSSGEIAFHPRILGRLVGEQDYPQNRHLCMFDRPFLEMLLSQVGFKDFATWNPQECGFERDSSFDNLDGIPTSLNVLAYK